MMYVYYKFIKYSSIVLIQRFLLTLIGLLAVVFSELETSININCNDTTCKYFSKTGKRMSKVATEAQEKSGFLTTYLVELFKNHKLIKIFQKKI